MLAPSLSKIGKLNRRIADLLRQVPHGTGSVAQQRLWNKCRSIGFNLFPDSRWQRWWFQELAPTADSLECLLVDVRRETHDLLSSVLSERERVWRESISELLSDGCKGEHTDCADMIARAD